MPKSVNNKPQPAARAGPRARDVVAALPADFRLAGGDALPQAAVRGRLYGPPGAPLVVVAGGISSGRHACLGPDGAPGWWPQVVADGGPVDTARLQVLAFDFAPEGLDRPVTITTTDQARLLALLLDAVGVRRIAAFVGASYGGAVGLAFAARFPQRLERLVVISAAHRTDVMATAVRGVQRRILKLACDTGRPDDGVALARELAMTTYRTAEEFADRFTGDPPDAAGGPYPVCDYLSARGRGYCRIMTPARWICLSDSLDRHRITPRDVAAPTTLVGFTSDRLVPIADIRDLAAALPNLERLVEAPSRFGHDGFLKEAGVVAEVLRAALVPCFTVQPEGIAA